MKWWTFCVTTLCISRLWGSLFLFAFVGGATTDELMVIMIALYAFCMVCVFINSFLKYSSAISNLWTKQTPAHPRPHKQNILICKWISNIIWNTFLIVICELHTNRMLADGCSLSSAARQPFDRNSYRYLLITDRRSHVSMFAVTSRMSSRSHLQSMNEYIFMMMCFPLPHARVAVDTIEYGISTGNKTHQASCCFPDRLLELKVLSFFHFFRPCFETTITACW